MGTWGTKVLQNDVALDHMIDIGKMSDHRVIYLATKELLSDFSATSQSSILLGVSIVDASLNGIADYQLYSTHENMYGYRKFFENLKEYPMEDLRERALQAINYLIEESAEYWGKNYCQQERTNIYNMFKSRLQVVD